MVFYVRKDGVEFLSGFYKTENESFGKTKDPFDTQEGWPIFVP